ncbi:MAG: glycosyltransferase [Bacteroidota bacterium]
MRLCRAIHNAGHSVELIIPGKKNSPSEDEIHQYYQLDTSFPITRIKIDYSGKGSIYIRAWRMARYILKQAHDAVYGRDSLVFAVCTWMGQEVFLDAHGPPRQKSGLYGLISHRLWSSDLLKGVTIVTEALRQNYESVGVPSKHIHLVRNASAPIRQVEAKLKFDRPVIGYIGHLYPGRGIDIIFEAAKALPQYQFLIVGGNEKDIAYWKKQGLSNNIKMIGFVPAGEVATYMRSCNLLLAPYQLEVGVWGGKENSVRYMSPIKLFEYMSSGIPMVVSDLPAIREVLSDQEATFCPPDDAKAWEQAIAEHFDYPSAGHLKALRAKALYSKFYSWEKRVLSLFNIFSTADKKI